MPRAAAPAAPPLAPAVVPPPPVEAPTIQSAILTPVAGLSPALVDMTKTDEDDVDTTPPPASLDVAQIGSIPAPAVPREAALMALEAADADAIESIDDAEALDELDAVEELDVGEPEPDHVRSHVSLPPPPPPPRGR